MKQRTQEKKGNFLEEEKKRLLAMSRLEAELQAAGYRLIAGVDEAGRGPLAGPVVAAAAVVPLGTIIPYLNDSKKLTAKQRDAVYQQILALKIPYGIGEASVGEIDRLNILNASRLAMLRAVRNLPVRPDFLLIDGYSWPGITLPHRGIIGGDGRSVSIAAASILAKVTRDRLMTELDRTYPGYGFAKHKGYPTAEHYAALARYGPTPVHRRSFNLHCQLPLAAADGRPLEVKEANP
ncbi:MAG TPA: ribonuclease HII [Capillibacterium sp.]